MKLTEINKIRCHAKKIKYGRSAMTPIRQFIITNFANIVIGLSLAFLISQSGSPSTLLAMILS